MNRKALWAGWSVVALIALTALGACNANPSSAPSPNPLSALPIDSARVATVQATSSWSYRRQVSADLDGEGDPETIVLTADVTVTADGRVLWEDGHRWALYVEGDSGPATLLYSAFVPNGFVEVAILAPDDAGRRKILIQERTPSQLRALEVEYAVGASRLSSFAYYQTEQWIPGSAAMP